MFAKHRVTNRGIAPKASPKTIAIILDLFSLLPRIETDAPTRELLRALEENVGFLSSENADTFVERLVDLVPAHGEQAARFANKILDLQGAAFKDMRTPIARTAEDMVTLAMTLHREESEPCRSLGMELFERLLGMELDTARQSLLRLDSRPVNSSSYRRRRRIRRPKMGRRRVVRKNE